MKRQAIVLATFVALTGCQPQATTAPGIPKQKLDGFFITTMGSAPGWQVVESQGFYCRIFDYSGTGDYMDRFNGAIEAIREVGQEAGANALVNLRISSESHEVQGSKWHSSIVHICGDMVVLE